MLHRADANDVGGLIKRVGEGGCVIKQPYCEEHATFVFIAYESIRGIATKD